MRVIFSVACLSCNFGLVTVLLSSRAFDDLSVFVSGEHTKISELVSWGAGNYWRNLAPGSLLEASRYGSGFLTPFGREREIGRFGCL